MGNIISSSMDRTPYDVLEASEGIPGLKDEFRGTCRTLVLGPDGSGKSAIVTQIKLAMDGGLSQPEVEAMRPYMLNDLASSALGIIGVADAHGLCFRDLKSDSLKAELEAFTKRLSTDTNHTMDPAIVEQIIQLHKDPLTTLIYDRHRSFAAGYELPASAIYFMESASRIGDKGYVPSIKDSLRTRMKTNYATNDVNIRIQSGRLIISEMSQTKALAKDVEERRKTAAIIYCVPLDSYDSPAFLTLLEDFKATVTSGWPSSTEVLVFLNKYDLFKEKIIKKPLGLYYSDCVGEDDSKASAMYIWGKFKRRNKFGLRIHCFVTNATSTMDTDYIVQLMKNQIIATWLHKTERRSK